MLFRTARIVATIVLLLISTCVVGQMPREMSSRVTISGMIRAIARGKIQVATPNAGLWLVDLSNQTSVMVTGKGDATLLSPGVYVKFQAEVTGREQLAKPIHRIQVFTPTPQDVPGAFPVQTPTPFGVESPRGAKKEPTAKPSSEMYHVIGRITSVQRGRMVVSYGKGTIEVEPAADLEVDLAVADIRFARPGDQIVCQCFLAGSEASRTARASSIQITTHGRPAIVPDAKKAAWPGESPKEQPQKSDEPQAGPDRLIEWLTPPREKALKKETFQIDDDPTVFQPCTARSVSALIREFGQPQKTQVSGVLTVHDRKKSGKWQLWTWGPVKVVIDRSRKARFFAVAKVPVASGKPVPKVP